MPPIQYQLYMSLHMSGLRCLMFQVSAGLQPKMWHAGHRSPTSKRRRIILKHWLLLLSSTMLGMLLRMKVLILTLQKKGQRIWNLVRKRIVMRIFTELIIMHISTYNSFLQLNLIIILVYTNYITTIHTSYTISNHVLRGWWLIRRKFRAVTIASRDLVWQHLHAKAWQVEMHF